MRDVNIENCGKSVYLAKTQHNEVAPAQHELAPIYADSEYRSRSQPDHHADIEESCMSAWYEVSAS